MMGARSIHQASAVAGRACVPATPRAARVAGARARLPAPHRQQLSTVRRALIDTELPVADAWDLDGRAALLGLTVDEVARLRDSVDERTWLWMGNAEPESEAGRVRAARRWWWWWHCARLHAAQVVVVVVGSGGVCLWVPTRELSRTRNGHRQHSACALLSGAQRRRSRLLQHNALTPPPPRVPTPRLRHTPPQACLR
jgi:hypothetical protein